MLVPVGYVDLQLDRPIALLRAAEATMRNAYVPYSNFPVGAALRGRSGAIYAAANVENAAYPARSVRRGLGDRRDGRRRGDRDHRRSGRC